MKAEVVKVIRTENTEGKGTEEDPVRTKVRYWTLKGEPIAQKVYIQKDIKQEG